MNMLRYLAVGSALALTLTTAAPVFAHADEKGKEGGDHKIGVHLGSILKDWRTDNKSDEKRETHMTAVSGTVSQINGTTITLLSSNGGVYTVNAANAAFTIGDDTSATIASVVIGNTLKVHGSLADGVIVATTVHNKMTQSNAASIEGTLTALTGSTLTIAGSNGLTYSVSVGTAKINGSTDFAAQLSKFQVGDKLSVRGSVSGTTVTAQKVTNESLRDREALVKHSGVRAGTVTAISGNTVTIDRFGNGTTSVITDANTFYLAGGSATSSNALIVGAPILVFGPTTTGTNDSISASVVVLLSHSVSFLKGMFR